MKTGLARYAAQQPRLRDEAGRELPGYFNESAVRATRAVVVVHDFFGLTPHIRGVTGRFAREGYVAFAPDLYRGGVAASREEAVVLASRLAWKQVAVELGLAISALKQRSPRMRVAVVGFAMGGAAALVAAAAALQLDAAVSFYGIPQDVVIENTHVRVQGHFANHDTKCTPERVTALEDALASKHIRTEIHRYDARNGFFNPTRPEAWSVENAEAAWARTLHFLEDALA